MKRLLCLLLIVCLLLPLAACGKTDKAPEQTEDSTTTSTENTTTSTEAVTTTVGESTGGTTTTSSATKTTGGTTTTERPTYATDFDPVGSTERPTYATDFDPVIPPEPDNRPQIKILAIGHSFAIDAMKAYMWDLFDAAGYNATIGYLFYSSCSIEQHYHYITENRPIYESYSKNKGDGWVSKGQATALSALWDEDWDIITFQPDPDFGNGKNNPHESFSCKWGCTKKVENDYVHFNDLVDYVLDSLADKNNPHGPNTDVKVYYHLTWSYRQDSWLGDYLYPGKYDQVALYQDFVTATKKYILPNKTVLGVIPAGTAIENARTSFLGDTFNAEGKNDGYHLNDRGDFTAALTWVSYFTGIKAKDIQYLFSPYTGKEFEAIAEAVDNAIATWDAVTASTYS